MWTLVYTKQAQKDGRKVKRAGLELKVKKLLEILAKNPFEPSPPYEKLLGDFMGAYSRRINIQHRLVYEVIKNEKIVKVIRLWTHYE